MDQGRQKEKTTQEALVFFSGAAVALIAVIYALLLLAGSWAVWVEYGGISLSVEIKILDDSIFELRVHNGSYNRKENLDHQENRLGSWWSDSAFCFDLCTAERGGKLNP
jgi:hypothetical protein